MNKKNLFAFALLSVFTITKIKAMEGSCDQQNPGEPSPGELTPKTHKLQEIQYQLERERQHFDFECEEMQKHLDREHREMREKCRERDQESADLKERIVFEEQKKWRKIIEDLKSEIAALKLAMEQTEEQMPQYAVQQIMIALESNLEQERETNRRLLEQQEEMENFIVSKFKSALGLQEQLSGDVSVDYLAIKNEIENLDKQGKTLKIQIVDKDK